MAGAATAAQAPQAACVSSPGRRVVSLGDWHGDWSHAVEALTALGLLRDGRWSGGDAVLVQTGDVVDRGDEGRRLLELLFRLQDEAQASGGRVVMLWGNHELMCMQSDLRYVSPTELQQAYGGVPQFRAAWAPHGDIGGELRRRGKVVALVGDVVYSHAGLLIDILDEFAPGAHGEAAVEMLNAKARTILQAEGPALQRPNMMLMDRGPFWTRSLGMSPEAVACPLLDPVLERLGARRMVVGHTPQRFGDISARCDGRLLVADTFMSQAYTHNAAASAHNAAAVEFHGGSSAKAAAVYPLRDAFEQCSALTEATPPRANQDDSMQAPVARQLSLVSAAPAGGSASMAVPMAALGVMTVAVLGLRRLTRAPRRAAGAASPKSDD